VAAIEHWIIAVYGAKPAEWNLGYDILLRTGERWWRAAGHVRSHAVRHGRLSRFTFTTGFES